MQQSRSIAAQPIEPQGPALVDPIEETRPTSLSCSHKLQVLQRSWSGPVRTQRRCDADTEALMAAVGTAGSASVDSAGPIQSNASATDGVMNRVNDAYTCRSPDVRC